MKDRLKKLRENRQLTQKDFGAKIGVSDKVVSKWKKERASRISVR